MQKKCACTLDGIISHGRGGYIGWDHIPWEGGRAYMYIWNNIFVGKLKGRRVISGGGGAYI